LAVRLAPETDNELHSSLPVSRAQSPLRFWLARQTHMKGHRARRDVQMGAMPWVYLLPPQQHLVKSKSLNSKDLRLLFECVAGIVYPKLHFGQRTILVRYYKTGPIIFWGN